MPNAEEPRDPFTDPDFTHPVVEGNLLWRQLVDLEMSSEIRHALAALSPQDLRYIVIAHLAAFYGKNNDIARRPPRLHKKDLEATVTSTASLTGLVTNHVYLIRRIPTALGAFVGGVAPVVGPLLKARLQHHGPLGDLAEETTNRGGEAAAERILRRAVRVVTRVWTFRA